MRLCLASLSVLVLAAAPLSAQALGPVKGQHPAVRQVGALGKDLESLEETHARYATAAQEIAAQRDRLGRMIASVAAGERGRTKEMDLLVADLAKMNQRFATLQKALQQEGRQYQTISNASKSRHEAAMNAIRNVR